MCLRVRGAQESTPLVVRQSRARKHPTTAKKPPLKALGFQIFSGKIGSTDRILALHSTRAMPRGLVFLINRYRTALVRLISKPPQCHHAAQICLLGLRVYGGHPRARGPGKPRDSPPPEGR